MRLVALANSCLETSDVEKSLRAYVAATLSFLLLFFAPLAASAKDGVVEINGVVQSMPASGLIGSWTIAGRAVRTDAATVIKQQLGAIGVGAVVEAKGVDDGNGVTLATTIEVKQGVSSPPPGTPSGDFTGAIQSMPTGTLLGTWTIAGRTVQVLTTTVLKQELGGFAVGATVEVHGTVGSDGTLVASSLEVKAGGAAAPVPSDSGLEVTGVVESLPASGLVGTWRVAGRDVIVGTGHRARMPSTARSRSARWSRRTARQARAARSSRRASSASPATAHRCPRSSSGARSKRCPRRRGSSACGR